MLVVMKKWWIGVGIVAAIGLVVILGLVLGPKAAVPGSIKRQVTSTLLVPQGGDTQVNRESMKYDSSIKLLTFNAVMGETKMVFSEQPTPDSLNDIPQVFDNLMSSMGQYSSFVTDTGTVNLTRPKELVGKQAAVLNSKGTLMFVKPDKDLSEDQWRKLFKNLAIVK